MRQLCDIVRENASALEAAIGQIDEITGDEPGSCVIRSPTLVIRIFVDRRDGSVSSSLVSLKAPEEYSEEYPTHVLARFFPDAHCENRPASGDLANDVKSELRCLADICSEMAAFDERRLRDLYYFYDGYSRSYTDRYI